MQPKFAFFKVRYHKSVSFGDMSLTIGPLCIAFISAWLNDEGSRCVYTVIYYLSTMKQLLYHSAVSSTLNTDIFLSSFILSNSLFSGKSR